MLSSQRGLVASHVSVPKFFRDDLTIVLEDAQCFDSILEPPQGSPEQRKIRYIFRIPLETANFSL